MKKAETHHSIINCQDCGIEVKILNRNKKYCTPCVDTRAKENRSKYYLREKEAGNLISSKTNEEELFEGARRRSKLYPNQIFDLTLEDIVIPTVCPVLKVPFIKNTSSAASVDRIDSNKGYYKGNIQIISRKANRMKNNASVEDLLNFANWVSQKKELKLNEKQIEDYVTNELSEKTFEELLEDHDLTPPEVFIILFNSGYIDPELLEDLMGN